MIERVVNRRTVSILGIEDCDGSRCDAKVDGFGPDFERVRCEGGSQVSPGRQEI